MFSEIPYSDDVFLSEEAFIKRKEMLNTISAIMRIRELLRDQYPDASALIPLNFNNPGEANNS
jgi:hypothetical protein